MQRQIPYPLPLSFVSPLATVFAAPSYVLSTDN